MDCLRMSKEWRFEKWTSSRELETVYLKNEETAVLKRLQTKKHMSQASQTDFYSPLVTNEHKKQIMLF